MPFITSGQMPFPLPSLPSPAPLLYLPGKRREQISNMDISSLKLLNASLMAFKVKSRLLMLVYKVLQDPAPAHFSHMKPFSFPNTPRLSSRWALAPSCSPAWNALPQISL